jgi:hypothetical protein
MVHNLLSCVWRKLLRFDFGNTTDQLRCTSLTLPLLRTRLDCWPENATWFTDIQISPTLTTCRVLHNTSPIVLVDSGGHMFARLAKTMMAEPGEGFVLLHKKKNGAVFAKVKTAPENSPATITNPRVDVSITNGGSLFYRPDQCSRKSYVDDTSSLLVSSLPSLFYTMSSHRDIYVIKLSRRDIPKCHMRLAVDHVHCLPKP